MTAELDDVTLVIPTHNRASYLKRILEYYEGASLKIAIADSSEIPYPFAIDSKNIDYYHYPGINLNKKLWYALSKVETKFVVMCADDDFTLPDAIAQCVDFLKQNEDFAVAQGNVVTYSKEQVARGIIEFSILYKNMLSFSINESDPMKRIERLFKNYRTIFYAVHYTENLQSAFEGASEAIRNLYLNEYVTVLPMANGNYAELPILFQVREFSSDSGDKVTVNVDQMLKDQAYEGQIELFMDFMTKKISRYIKRPSDYIRNILVACLNDFGKRISDSKRPSYKKRVGNLIANFPLMGKKIIRLNRKLEALRKENLSLVVRTGKEKQELDLIRLIILKYKDTL